MKPLYFKRFTLATNASTWLPRQPPIQMDKTVHRSQSSQIVKQQSASESNEPNQDSVLIQKISQFDFPRLKVILYSECKDNEK